MDWSDKPNTSRWESFKRKSSTIDKREWRIQLRNIERKEKRREEFDSVRNISPAKEDGKGSEKSKAKAKADERREALMKWKRERDLKKKLEKEKKSTKPPFRSGLATNLSMKPLPKVSGTVVKTKQKTEPPVSSRVLRSASASVSAPQVSERVLRSSTTSGHQNAKQCQVKQSSENTSAESSRGRRTTRSLISLTVTPPTRGRKQKQSTDTKQVIKPKKIRKTSKRETSSDEDNCVADDQTTSAGENFTMLNSDKITGLRSSFAADSFVFQPPECLPTLSFKPMSPASQADFLFPGNSFSDVFKVPTSSGSRIRRQRNYTNSLILRKMSPEEKDKVISQSPMVETKRRTPKLSSEKNSPTDPLPTFDDIDMKLLPKMDKEAWEEAEQLFSIEEEETTDIDSVEHPTDIHLTDAQHADTTNVVIEKEAVSITESPSPDNTGEQNSEQQNTETMEVELNDGRDEACDSHVGEMAKPKEALHTDVEEDSLKGENVKSSKDITEKQPLTDSKCDAGYFRRTVESESERLNALSAKWNEKVSRDEEIPEAAQGQIRSTVGKAQLLVNKRFKQFSGLVDDCQFGKGEREILSSDLQGFWDVIYFQVEDVNKMFEQLDKLEANNWQSDEPKAQIKKKTKKKVSSNKPVRPSAGIKSKFADFRAKIKQQKVGTDSGSPFVKATNEMKTFDAVFFQVNSPVSSPKYHCDAGTPGKQHGNISPLHRNVVMKHHLRNQLTGASPSLQSHTAKPHTSPCQETPTKTTNTPVKLGNTKENESSGRQLAITEKDNGDKFTSDVQPSPARYRTRRSILKTISTDKKQNMEDVVHKILDMPAESPKPIKHGRKSMRRSLRLQSLSNSFNLSKTPRQLRNGKELPLGNQSLNMESMENTNKLAASAPRQRSSSGPSGNAVFGGLPFTPMVHLDEDLIVFSPLNNQTAD